MFDKLWRKGTDRPEAASRCAACQRPFVPASPGAALCDRCRLEGVKRVAEHARTLRRLLDELRGLTGRRAEAVYVQAGRLVAQLAAEEKRSGVPCAPSAKEWRASLEALRPAEERGFARQTEASHRLEACDWVSGEADSSGAGLREIPQQGERRRARRLRLQAKALIQPSNATARLEDVSVTGAAVVTAIRRSVGTRVRLVVETENGSLTRDGFVRRLCPLEDGTFRLGVQFETPLPSLEAFRGQAAREQGDREPPAPERPGPAKGRVIHL